MRFDNIIIGGGLSGLVAAIESQKAGRNTAIVSACLLYTSDAADEL